MTLYQTDFNKSAYPQIDSYDKCAGDSTAQRLMVRQVCPVIMDAILKGKVWYEEQN